MFEKTKQINKYGDNVLGNKTITNVYVETSPKSNPTPKELTGSLGKKTKFVGRKKELKELKTELEENNSVLLVNGIAGAGKSSLASAFLDTYKDDYAHVGFVEVLSDIKSAVYEKLSVIMELEQFPTSEQNFDECIKKLRALDGNTLLVLDDVQKPEEQKDAIDALLTLCSQNIQILFTSRRKLKNIVSYTLEKLSPEDALALFDEYYKTDNVADVTYIIEHVSHHAYFVEHIAKIIHNDDDMNRVIQKMKCGDFSKIVYTDDEDGQEHQFSDNLHTLFNLQHKEITSEYILILKRLSVLPSVDISYEKLDTFLEVKEARLTFLVNRGWLIGSENGYKLHQITKEYILAYHMPDIEDIKIPFEAIKDTLIKSSASDDIKIKYETILYAKSCVSILDTLDIKSKEMGVFYGNFALLCHYIGDYATALTYLTKSLAIQEEIGDKAGEGATLNNISQIYDAQGDYATALTYLTKSLAIREEIGDKAGMCATLINMGHISWQDGQKDEAMQGWIRAYTIAKVIGSAQALDALKSLAEHVGLENGLESWEKLAQESKHKNDN